ncbi:SEC-C metal-binding domain-containing protein [Desulfosarcina variabilis]|uniref:YecA family protein n=1 Tax=Desulfosarcina variabilis TaxID=2300 RepID=UPI003AFB2ABD
MKKLIENHLDIIHQTRRCRPEIQAAAESLIERTATDWHAVIDALIQSGQDTALGIAFAICAVNGVRLDPAIAAEALKVIEPIIDFAPVFRFQNQAAIPHLLRIAQSDELSTERQLYAGLIAAEMSIVHQVDPQPVRLVLSKLEHAYGITPMLQAMLASALYLIDAEKEQPEKDQFLSQADVLAMLPKKRPPVVIASGQTMRRPVEKVGRNDPCPCGSGKKYKKCCIDKDREKFHDASSYAGITKSQLRASPQLVDDTQFIQEMRAYELKKLVPETLNADQLFAAYHRCELFGLRSLAFDMLKTLEKRPDAHDFDIGHFEDLLEDTLRAGDIELASAIRRHIPDDDLTHPEMTRLVLDLLQNNPTMERLEAMLRLELTQPDELEFDPPSLHLSFVLENTYPALSINFGRAFIGGNPDRIFDNETLVESIRKSRAEIGIEAWDDPIEDYMDWCIEKDVQENQEKDKNQQITQILEEASAARKKARQKEIELRQKEKELESLSAELNKKKQHPLPVIPEQSPPPASQSNQDQKTISDLRQRIERLKGEISSQQQLRRELRGKLKAEKVKWQSQAESSTTPQEEALSPPAFSPPPTFKTILVPEYAPAFSRACKSVPPPVAAKAIKAIGAFAAAEDSIWQMTRPIKRIAQHYRIRISRTYRVLLRWEPNQKIEALDVIHRSELELWIRNHC